MFVLFFFSSNNDTFQMANKINNHRVKYIRWNESSTGRLHVTLCIWIDQNRINMLGWLGSPPCDDDGDLFFLDETHNKHVNLCLVATLSRHHYKCNQFFYVLLIFLFWLIKFSLISHRARTIVYDVLSFVAIHWAHHSFFHYFFHLPFSTNKRIGENSMRNAFNVFFCSEPRFFFVCRFSFSPKPNHLLY